MKIKPVFLLAAIAAKEGRLNKLLVGQIKLGWFQFEAIPDDFKNMTFSDFIRCDMIFENAELLLSENKDAHNAMARLCALLYRITPLELPTDDQINERWDLWREVDAETVSAIFLNYREMRYFLTKKYPYIWPQNYSEEGEVKTKNKSGGFMKSDWLAWRDKLAITFHTTPDGANKILLSDALRYIDRELK